MKQNHTLVADCSIGQEWKYRPIKTPAPHDITTSGIQQILLKQKKRWFQTAKRVPAQAVSKEATQGISR